MRFALSGGFRDRATRVNWKVKSWPNWQRDSAPSTKTAATTCQEPLDYPRRNSPHYWLHRQNRHRMDDGHHRGGGRRDPCTTRDGRTRGRRPEALLLSQGPPAVPIPLVTAAETRSLFG